MIIKCTCLHQYQDQKHGTGMRVCNSTNTENKYRCTVCKAEVHGKVEKIENKKH